jgi:hypothetical protein
MEKYKPYAEKLAVYGCYSIAAVYILVGTMAILSFLGILVAKADEERIVGVILELPMGWLIIVLIVAGMAGYVLWRIFESVTDPYNFGSDFGGIAKRVGIALSAGGYVLIGYSATEILISGNSGNGEEEQQIMVAQVLSFPGGAWMVGFAGAVIAFAALIQFKYVAGGEYKKRLKFQSMSKAMETAIHFFAWAGYIARGIILAVIGYFFIAAAIKADAGEIGDTDTAFDFLGDFGTPGHVVFIAVAIGTIFYGFYMILNGYYYCFEEEEKTKPDI